MVVVLTVQKFDGIEKIDFEPDFTVRISSHQWEVRDPLLLWDVKRELAATCYSDYPGKEKEIELLIRRLNGAVQFALKEHGGWKLPSSTDCNIRQDGGKTLREYGLIATRYNSEPKDKGFRHTTIDLKFENGTEISVPCETDVLWTSEPFIVKGLNDLNFQGGNWSVGKPSSVWTKFFD